MKSNWQRNIAKSDELIEDVLEYNHQNYINQNSFYPKSPGKRSASEIEETQITTDKLTASTLECTEILEPEPKNFELM